MKIENLSRSLAEHPFVAGLGADRAEFLNGCTRNVRFAPDEYLFREDTAADHLYLLRTGHVDLESRMPGRGAVAVERLGSGDVLGASAVYGPCAWNIDARAVTPVLAFDVDGVCLRAKLEADPAFGLAIVRRMLEAVHRRLGAARLQQLDVYKAEILEEV